MRRQRREAGAVVGDDVSKAIGWVHMSGAMHDTVAANPEAYLHPSPRLGGLLRAARDTLASGEKTLNATSALAELAGAYQAEHARQSSVAERERELGGRAESRRDAAHAEVAELRAA